MKTTKPLKVPENFYMFIEELAQQHSKDTGYAKNKSAVMRKMGTELRGKLILRNNKFDWRIY